MKDIARQSVWSFFFMLWVALILSTAQAGEPPPIPETPPPTANQQPAQPNLWATVTSGQANFHWDMDQANNFNPEHEGFEIFSCSEDNSTYSFAKEITSPKTSNATINGLTDNKEYYFSLRSYYTSNYGEKVYSSFADPITVIPPNPFSIYANSGPGGTISPQGTISVNPGQDQTFQFTPQTGYHIYSVQVDNEYMGNQGSYQFEQLNADHNISVQFTKAPPPVVNTAPEVGLQQPPAPTLMAIPDSGQATLKWKIEDQEGIEPPLAGFQILQFNASTNVYTELKKTASNASNCTISSLNNAKPYYFTMRSYSVQDEKPVYSQFAYPIMVIPPDPFSITSSAKKGGSITPEGLVKVNPGADKSFKITPDEGYQIEEILLDHISIPVQEKITLKQIVINDHTLEVTFAKAPPKIIKFPPSTNLQLSKPELSVQWGDQSAELFWNIPDANGWSPEHEGFEILEYNSSAESYTSLIAKIDNPNTTSYTVEGLNNNQPYYYTLRSFYDQNGTPIYSSYADPVMAIPKGIATITASVNGTGGSLIPSGTLTKYTGTDQTFNISPDSGYYVLDVVVDGQSKGSLSSYTFENISAGAHSIVASFTQEKPSTYTIVATAGTGGSISPAGNNTVNAGDDISFEISEDSGYAIEDVRIDGASQGQLSTYTFEDVNADHQIEAFFTNETITEYTIVASVNGTGGVITPSGEVSVAVNGTKGFEIKANSGYTISDLRVDGKSIGPISSYTFEKVNAGHTITAFFKQESAVDGCFINTAVSSLTLKGNTRLVSNLFLPIHLWLFLCLFIFIFIPIHICRVLPNAKNIFGITAQHNSLHIFNLPKILLKKQ